MTRTLRSSARPAVLPAAAAPELAGLTDLQGAALAKQLRALTTKTGVYAAAPHQTWRLVAPALACGLPQADALVAAALRIGADGADAAFKQALGGWLKVAARKTWRGPARALFGVETGAVGKPPAPCGFEDRAAGFALLRRDWTAAGAALAFRHGDAGEALALRFGAFALLDGAWALEIAKDGAAVARTGPWRSVCWSADDDGEYLELLAPVAGGGVLARQLFTARHVPWVYLADTVHSPERGQWALRWRLPAAAGVAGRGGLMSRGLRLAGTPFPVDAVPLALPENPLQPGRGMLRVANGELLAEAIGDGAGVTLPLAFAWAPTGALPPTSWKRLTITHDRRVVAPDEASAFRIGVGGKQCVAFRTQHANFRTAFLGHQTFDECLIGWLNPAARDLEAWLRIE